MKNHIRAAIFAGLMSSLLAGYPACAFADATPAQPANTTNTAATGCKPDHIPVKKHVHTVRKAQTVHTKTASTHGMTSSMKVRVAQMRLADLGYFVGYPNGVLNTHTKKALISFQRIHHIKATGTLTDKTFKTLCMADYLAHHYYLTSVRDPQGVTYTSSYPYNQPGHINPVTGAWTVAANNRR